MISDVASGPLPIVGGHVKLLHDDCSAVYSNVDREGLRLTIIECLPGSFKVGLASWRACLYLVLEVNLES